MTETTSSAYPTSQIGKRLPLDFKIGENDVYVGRGNLYRCHPGNERFNEIVTANLERYYYAPSRNDKTKIIYEVVDHVRANSPNGGFVKKDTKSGRWYEVGDIVAREKTSQAFRDATIGIYKSSRVLRPNKEPREKTRSSGEMERISSAPTTMSKKRSFTDTCTNDDDTESDDVKPSWQQHNEQVPASGVNQSYEQQNLSKESIDEQGRVISPSNRMMEDPCLEQLDEKVILSLDNSFREYRRVKSHSSEASSSCSSNTITVDDIFNWEPNEGTTAGEAAAVAQIPSSIVTSTVPSTVEHAFDQQMMLLNPSMATMFASTAVVHDAKTDNEIIIPAPAPSLDTKSDEETFDLLLQLYESWKR